MIVLNCPKCAKEFKIKDEHAGRKFACTKCGKECRIPTLQELQKPSAIAMAVPVPTKVSPTPTPPKRSVKASAKSPEKNASETRDKAQAEANAEVKALVAVAKAENRKETPEPPDSSDCWVLPLLKPEPPLCTLEHETWGDRFNKLMESDGKSIWFIAGSCVFLLIALTSSQTPHRSNPVDLSKPAAVESTRRSDDHRCQNCGALITGFFSGDSVLCDRCWKTGKANQEEMKRIEYMLKQGRL